jgi:hypothetical protein
MAMALTAVDLHGFSTRRPDHQEKDSVMEYGPLVCVLSLMLIVPGVGMAIGLARHEERLAGACRDSPLSRQSRSRC